MPLTQGTSQGTFCLWCPYSCCRIWVGTDGSVPQMSLHFRTVRVSWYCIWCVVSNRGHQEAVESHFLDIFKTPMDVVLSNLFYLTLFEQGGWSRWSPKAAPNLNHSVTLWFCEDWQLYKVGQRVIHFLMYISLYTNMPGEVPLSVSQAKAGLLKPCDNFVRAPLKDLLEVGSWIWKKLHSYLSTSILLDKGGGQCGFPLSTSNPTAPWPSSSICIKVQCVVPTWVVVDLRPHHGTFSVHEDGYTTPHQAMWVCVSCGAVASIPSSKLGPHHFDSICYALGCMNRPLCSILPIQNVHSTKRDGHREAPAPCHLWWPVFVLLWLLLSTSVPVPHLWCWEDHFGGYFKFTVVALVSLPSNTSHTAGERVEDAPSSIG